MLKNTDRYLKNISKHLKVSKKHFKKLQIYHYGIDYLFNDHNDINVFQEAKMLLNERRSNLFREKTNEIRKNSIKKKVSIIF